jgi:hypothetical protein
MCFCFLSCKSNYTKIGDKDANYIPYYLKVNEADSLYIVEDYVKSHKILDSLFLKYEPANSDVFYEYGTYLMSCVAVNDTNKIKKKMAYSFEKFGAMHIPTNPIEKYMYLNDIYKSDSLYFLKLRENYLKRIDYSLIAKIQEMVKLDQSNRCLNTSENKRKIEVIDSINSIKLKEVIKNNVYPNYYIIGYFEPGLNDSARISTILMHQDRATVFKYLPLIEDAVKKGKCSPYEYSVIYDKCMWVYGDENEKQKFNSNETENKQEIDSKVRINRKEIGLPSTSYFKWKNGF